MRKRGFLIVTMALFLASMAGAGFTATGSGGSHEAHHPGLTQQQDQAQAPGNEMCTTGPSMMNRGTMEGMMGDGMRHAGPTNGCATADTRDCRTVRSGC